MNLPPPPGMIQDSQVLPNAKNHCFRKASALFQISGVAQYNLSLTMSIYGWAKIDNGMTYKIFNEHLLHLFSLLWFEHKYLINMSE